MAEEIEENVDMIVFGKQKAERRPKWASLGLRKHGLGLLHPESGRSEAATVRGRSVGSVARGPHCRRQK